VTTKTAIGREPRRCAHTVLTAHGKSTLRVQKRSADEASEDEYEPTDDETR
jgi:hypothetical protein